MARKSAAALIDPRVTEAVEMAEMEADVRGELADAALKVQDDKTTALVERMAVELRKHVTGNIMIGDKTARLSEEFLQANLRYVATEILKNLAVFDIRVGTYVIPSDLCVLCGVEL